MKNYLLMFAFILPLMAQEVEVKETDGKTEVTVKKQYDKKKWNRGDMKRGGGKSRGVDKRMMMAKRRKMQKKRFWRSAVRVVVIGGVAYYVGYQQGMKKDRKGGPKRPIWMGDREKKQ